MIETYFKNETSTFGLSLGDCVEVMSQIADAGFHFDMVFADPPYFLSNGGISVQSGKQVCVDKGEWDKSQGTEQDLMFTRKWLNAVRSILKPSGTIWISGTHHNIFQIAHCLTELGYKILNVITWQKTNPPPNLSCRYFTYSTEFIVWARREKNIPHLYNYELMKAINGGEQMRDVWTMPAIGRWEKHFGKHPTQKPLHLLCRILLAATNERDWVLDPFTGSSTTGIACTLLNRRFLGIDREKDFLDLSIKRQKECQDPGIKQDYRRRIPDLQCINNCNDMHEGIEEYGERLF